MTSSIEQYIASRTDIQKIQLQNSSVYQRNTFLMSNYRIKLNFAGTNNWVELGRGAIAHSMKIKNFKTDGEQQQIVLSIGDLTEIANDASIILGGENFNDKIMNLNLSGLLDSKLAKNGVTPKTGFTRSKGKTTIGNAVVISSGAKILSGVTIGDCAVIGANAIVTKDVPAYAIVAGNPAKIIGTRLSDAEIKRSNNLAWWKLKSNILVDNLEKINNQEDCNFTADSYYTDADNKGYLVMTAVPVPNRPEVQHHLTGIEYNGGFISLEKCPDIVKFFIQQLNAPLDNPVHVVKDLFSIIKEIKVSA